MKEKVVLYARVKPINKKYLEKMGLNLNHPVSACLDAVLDSVRLKRTPTLRQKQNKVIERLNAIKDKKRQKIKALS